MSELEMSEHQNARYSRVHPAQNPYMEYYADDNVSLKPSDEHRNSWDHLTSDSTDDEQEDLPYDGILECYLVPSLQPGKVDKSSTCFLSPQALTNFEESPSSNSPIHSETTTDKALYSLDSSDFSLSEAISSLIIQTNEDIEQEYEKLLTVPTIIPDVLLRHISEGDLVNPSEFIAYETMPEISIVESSDEIAISGKSDAKLKYCLYSENQGDFKEEYLEICRKKNHDMQENMSNSEIGETSTRENEEENESEHNIQEDVEVDEFPQDNVDKEFKQSTSDLHRRPSYEMKYGQGQVHYKLPDFSKVPPKVKIPKCDNGAAKCDHPIKKTASNLTEQSFLIQHILDSMQPCIKPEQMEEDAAFVEQWHGQLLVDSDFNSEVNTVSPSECFPSNTCQFLGHVENQHGVICPGLQDSALEYCGSVLEQPQIAERARTVTEGERMTRLLMEQVQALKIKVEGFSDRLVKTSLPGTEQLLVFQSLKSSLETLEIDYLSTKEKHRDLHLQIYRTGSQEVGEFDIEREVEGHIFRLGMLLEDIQEQITKSEENDTTIELRSQPLQNSYVKETDDVKDRVTNNNIVTWSPNSRAASETHVQDSPVVKEAMDSLHPQCVHPDISAGITGAGLDFALSDHSTEISINQLARKEDIVLSNYNGPLILSGEVCNPKDQNSFSQVGCPEDWMLAEHSGFVEKIQITGKLKKNIGEFPLHLRCEKDEMRKSPKQFRKPRKLSIFVDEKPVKRNLTNCNGTQNSLNPEWLVSSHSGLFQCRSRRSISDKNGVYEEYPEQKSLWSSKLPLYVQNQSSLSNRLYHIRDNISHCVTSSRSRGQSSASHHSQLVNSTVSTLQRKRWKNKLNKEDYPDYKILNSVLDNALRTAKNMQKTTERMVQKLATDLVNPIYRNSYTV